MLLIHETANSFAHVNPSNPVLLYASAGATRATVSVTVRGLPAGWRLGQPLPGTLRVRMSSSLLDAVYVPEPSTSRVVLVLHDGDSETWHGAGICNPTGATDRSPRTRVLPHPGQKWLATSSSGGGDIAAGLWVLASEPLAIKTSGYKGRRHWRIETIDPDSLAVDCASTDEWLAARQQEEVL